MATRFLPWRHAVFHFETEEVPGSPPCGSAAFACTCYRAGFRSIILTYIRCLKREYVVEYKTYMCVICGFIYEEEMGLPEEGFAPGTRWEDIPDTWICPDCDAGKEDFEMVEI